MDGTLSMKNLLSVLSAIATVAIMSAFLMVGSPAPAYAAQDSDKIEEALTQDQLKRFDRMPDEDKRSLLDEVIADISKDKCGDFRYFTKMENFLDFQKRNCEEQTRDALKVMYPDPTSFVNGEGPKTEFCEALHESKASGEGVRLCTQQRLHTQVWSWTGTQIRGLLEKTELGRGVLNVSDALGNTVKFIADPKSSLEEVANSSKSESIALTTKVLEEISSTTEFDASSKEFKDRWALYAGLGIVGLGLMMMFLFKQHSNGEMSDDDFSNSLLYYLPASLFLVIYGPWLMNELQQRVAPLTDGTSDWAADTISNFIVVISRFASLESTSWFGPLAAIIFFGLLFIGAIALLIYFLLIPIFQQLMGLAIALLIGMLLSPKTRRYVLKIATALGTMILLKPAAFLVLGAVFGVLASQPAFDGDVDDVLVNVGNLGATAAIMLMIVLSPAALFRWMPVMESREAKFGGISPEISAGVGGAVGGAIGSGAGSVRRAISKRRNSASSGSSGSSGGGGTESAGFGGNFDGGNRAGDNSSLTERSSNRSPGTKNNGSQERSSQDDGGSPSTDSAQLGAGNPTPGGGSTQGSRSNDSESARQGSDDNSDSGSSSNGSSSPSEGASQGRHSAPPSRAKSMASAAATAAFTPLTAGAVGLLAGTKHAAANAASQARMAADNADPDSWDSFKDR
jgi:hypothetical protein